MTTNAPLTERYINPYTDFVFTRLFEQAEISKAMLDKGMKTKDVREKKGLTEDDISNLNG